MKEYFGLHSFDDSIIHGGDFVDFEMFLFGIFNVLFELFLSEVHFVHVEMLLFGLFIGIEESEDLS